MTNIYSQQKIRDLILNHRQAETEYQRLEQEGIKEPYFLSIKNVDQTLYYIGAKHINDPQDNQGELIQSYWHEFLKITQVNKRVAMVEGGVRRVAESSTLAIEKDAEPGLVTYLANRDGVEAISPEPSYKSQIELLQQFTKDEIAYYFFARVAWQWHRLTSKPTFEEYMQHFADTHKRRTGWDGYDFSLSHMIELHDQTHDHSFSMNDLDCFKTSSNPDKSPVPDKLSAFRDQSIVQAIFDRWQEGYSIFIVYGSGHWVTQRGALETILR